MWSEPVPPIHIMFPDSQLIDIRPLRNLAAIESDTQALGFTMSSDRQTGALLRHMAATVSAGRLLELGTGTGIATCWLLDGMGQASRLVTVDSDLQVLDVARRHLGGDHRVTIVHEDAADYLKRAPDRGFDLVFADAWPGKFTHLDLALSLLAEDGVYIADDLLPQPSWPENHAPRIPAFLADLRSRAGFAVEYREWASGILIARKSAQQG